MVEGLSKGSGLALLAVPMVEAFTFNQAQFRRILIKHLGLSGDSPCRGLITSAMESHAP